MNVLRNSYESRQFLIYLGKKMEGFFYVHIKKYSFEHQVDLKISFEVDGEKKLLLEDMGLTFDEMEQIADKFIEKYMKENDLKIEV